MQGALFRLMGEAGLNCQPSARSYRLNGLLPGFSTKILKPRNIVEMLHVGTRDAGFAGADWVAEIGADLVEVLDLGLDPVRLVAAAPDDLVVDGKLPARELRVASEYENLTARWIERRDLPARVIRAFGATEVFPPEDADCIVDNVSSGATLLANHLTVVDELMTSSTRLYANRQAMDNSVHRDRIGQLALLLRSVLNARDRVLLEINVPAESLSRVVEVLPCMRQPTVSKLYSESGFAVRAAVPRQELPQIIPAVKDCGGTDLLVSSLSQIVP